MRNRWMTVAILALAVALAAGCTGAPSGDSANREIEVSVTDKGFEPSRIEVKKGDNVTLVVTRKTDQTCATGIVVADRGITKDLPLNEPVRVAIGSVEGGEIGFACPMDMIKGTVAAN
jgi:plastocyanin domain-containing protein